jgi:hypothetical protein
MANNLGSLVVSLGLDAAEFTKGLTKNQYQAQQWARNVETAVESVRTYALGSFAAIGGAIAILNKQANDVSAFQELADKIGDTAQEVASLKAATDLSGVSLDTVASASVKLTAALAKTDDESKGVGAALASIGLEIEAFKKLQPAEQMDKVSEALAGFADGAGKTAVAVQLFGRSGADLIPFFNDLAEVGGRQITLTNEQIRAADEYSKATARLAGEVDTLAKIAAAEASPALQRMVEMLGETLRYSSGAADGVNLLTGALGIARTAMEAIIVVGSDVAFTFKTLGDTIGAYAAVSASLLRGDVAGAKAIGAAYREASEERRKALDRFQGGVLNPVTFGADDQSNAEARRLGLASAPRAISFAGVTAGGGRPSKTSTPKTQDPDASAIKYLESLQRQLEATQELTVVETTLRDIQLGRLGVVSDTQRAALVNTAAEIDASRQFAQIERDFAAAQSDTTAALKLREQAGKRVYESTRTPLESLNAQMADLDKLLADGAIDWDTYSRATLNASDSLFKFAEGQREISVAGEQAGNIFGGWLERAIVDGAKLSDVINGLIKDFVRLAIQKSVIEPAAAGFSTFVGGLFAGGASFDGGGYTGSGPRSGGMDGKGGFLAMLHPQETVVDHTKGQRMGGGVTIINNNDFRGADPGSELRIRQAIKENGMQTEARILSSMNKGGTFARASGRA